VLIEKRKSFGAGEDNEDTLRTLLEIAFMMYKQDLYEEALAFAEEGLEKCVRVLGNDHQVTLDFMNQVALLLGEL